MLKKKKLSLQVMFKKKLQNNYYKIKKVFLDDYIGAMLV